MFGFFKKCLLSAALCGLALSAQAADTKSDDTLLVGCEGAFAPFTYIDDKGEITGFDIDLIRAMGEALGKKVEIRVMPFDGLIPALMTDSIDLIISGFTITEERAKKVDFSDPYYLCGLTFLTHEKDEDKFKTIKDLDGQKVCLQLATSGAEFAKKVLGKAELKLFNSPPETYLELANNGCVAVINDRPVNDYYLTQTRPAGVISVEISTDDKEYYGIAVNKGNKALLDEINKGLKLTQENGSFEKISELWFGYDISKNLK